MADDTPDTATAKPNAAPDDGKNKAAKNPLGLSKGIYGAGYSAKDGYIYGTAAFIGTAAILWLGERFKIPGIMWVKGKLERVHNWWENAKGSVGLGRGEIVLAAAVSFLVGHLAAAPAFRTGWMKGQAIIDAHNNVVAEKDQVIESGKLLQQENEALKAALAKAQENRPSYAEQVRANAPAAPGMSA